MHRPHRNKQPSGFTLIELVVSMIVVSVIATIALVNYHKTLIIEHEREASTQLKIIYHANGLYKNKTGTYLPGFDLDLSAINSGLGLNIFSNNLTYSYDENVTWGFLAEAAYGTQFTIRIYGDFALSSLVDAPQSQLAGLADFNPFQTALSNLLVSAAHAGGNPNANPCCASGTCHLIPDCY